MLHRLLKISRRKVPTRRNFSTSRNLSSPRKRYVCIPWIRQIKILSKEKFSRDTKLLDEIIEGHQRILILFEEKMSPRPWSIRNIFILEENRGGQKWWMIDQLKWIFTIVKLFVDTTFSSHVGWMGIPSNQRSIWQDRRRNIYSCRFDEGYEKNRAKKNRWIEIRWRSTIRAPQAKIGENRRRDSGCFRKVEI